MKCRSCGESIGSVFWLGKCGTVSYPVCSSLCGAIIDCEMVAAENAQPKWKQMSRQYVQRAAAVAMSILFLMGCGSGLQSQLTGIDKALNAVTGIADPLYGAAVASCNSAERLAIAESTTREKALADIAAIRDVCDRAFAAFEALRNAQLAARDVVTVARETNAEPDIMAALGALATVESAVKEARAAWDAASEVVQGTQAP